MAEESGFSLGFGMRLSLNAQGNLRRASDTLSQSLQRLSSGQRINSAADDPASLSVASKLKADKGVYSKAVQNVNDAISLTNMAYDGLESLVEIATRQVELATQAESTSLSHTQRVAMNDEANALVEEFNRIVATTDWNGLEPYDGSLSNVAIQAGYGSEAVIALQFGQDLQRTVGSGGFTSAGSFAAAVSTRDVMFGDVDEDGFLDMVSVSESSGGGYVYIGNGNGSFDARVSYAMGSSTVGVYLSDLNNDDHLDLITADNGNNKIYVAFGAGNGTFSSIRSYAVGGNPRNIEVSDLDNDGFNDIVVDDRNSPGAGFVLMNAGDGTFGTSTSYAAGDDTRRVRVADFNNDGMYDLLSINASSMPTLRLGNGDGTFRAQQTLSAGSYGFEAAVGDFNGDGHQDFAVSTVGSGSLVVAIGGGDGTFYSAATVASRTGSRSIKTDDFNNDGILDLIVSNSDDNTVSLFNGAGDGTFTFQRSFAVGAFPFEVAIGDLNNDGSLDLASADSGGTGITVLMQGTDRVSTIAAMNLLSAEDAAVSADAARETLERVSVELGNAGAQSVRLSTAVNNLQSMTVNFDLAYSRIMDVDVAEETAQYVRSSIVQSGATAMLAQANQEMGMVMNLIDSVLGKKD